MNDLEKIRSVVARFFNVPESAISEEFVFPSDRLQGSVGRTTFHAALKRLAGADMPSAMTATNYRELLQPIRGPSPEAPAAAPSPSVTQPPPADNGGSNNKNGFGVGIDIESVELLPIAKDPWTDAFYRDNFTDAEIAYCLRQSDPRMSFCGLWSAKEAAMKCDPAIAALRPAQIEITHDEQRRPGLRVHGVGPLQESDSFVVSISHAGAMGIAVCVRKPGHALNPLPQQQDEAAPGDAPGQGSDSGRRLRRLVLLNLALSVLALALWGFMFATRK
jgi:phosphopantetheine--protein transferase-like protein